MTTKIISFIYKYLKSIWALITIVVLGVVLYCNLQISYNQAYKEIFEITKEVSSTIDGFIEDLYQEVYTLPLYGKNIRQCTPQLYSNLEHIVLNNPRISGLIISNKKHEAICSTIQYIQLNTGIKGPSRMLLGPFVHPFFEQPIYLVRQKIGPYYIDLVVVASVLKKVIELPDNLPNSVVLYDQLNKKELIRLQYNEEHNSRILNPDHTQLDPDSEFLFVVDKLHSIEGIALHVFENKKNMKNNMLLREFFVSVFVLLIFYSLYRLITYNINEHHSLGRTLKRALKNKQFYPVYQPIFDYQNKRYSSMELLLRWQDNEGKVIMPNVFIKKAESTGLIIPITLQTIETSFQEISSFLKQTPDFHIAINLSVAHFTDAQFFNQFNKLRAKWGIQAKQVLLEITERDLFDIHNTLFSKKMGELRDAGFSLAVDDYGTGHASIGYLQNFPFNYLKIDKLFIHAIGTKAITESLNDAIIQMAKGLNLIIIAEGVETQEQVDYLAKNEVRYMQGWYFSKEVSIDRIKKLAQETKHV